MQKEIKRVEFMTYCDNDILELADWITGRWGKGFVHKYPIAESKSAVWKKWRNDIQPNSPDEWWCESIGQAAHHYSWSPTSPSFKLLSKNLQEAVAIKDESACLASCLDIFKWGGVARKANDRSNQWVIQKAQSGELCSRLERAVLLLSPECVESLEEFDGKRLLMNSALTKVYAAADPKHQIVIYDGRVGAALGLMVRRMLEEKEIAQIPESLMFDWGPPSSVKAAKLRTRDPSSARLKFKQLPNTSQKADADLRRAMLSRRTNSLLSSVVNTLRSQNEEIQPIDLERALFMIGYDVRE